MGATVTVYGLSTEGYDLARKMAINGVDVKLIDESTPTAISFKPEIANIYPTISSFKEDEPLLNMEPIDIAISKSNYLFFAPRLRNSGQDLKTEATSKFREIMQYLKKSSSVIYMLGVGFNGNNELVSLLEHKTGFEVGKSISFFYYPVISKFQPSDVIGSFEGRTDDNLLSLLNSKNNETQFVSLQSSEFSHAINVLTQFSELCSKLEIFKLAKSGKIKSELRLGKSNEIFLDDMINGLYDLRSLGSSIEGTGTLTYLVNGSIKGIEGYLKRLVDIVRITLKKNELKASRTKIILSWSLDQHEMRGDKIDVMNSLSSRLHDYIGDVESYTDSFDLFHNDKKTILIVCSKKDYDSFRKNKKHSDIILIKTTPLCEVLQ